MLIYGGEDNRTMNKALKKGKKVFVVPKLVSETVVADCGEKCCKDI